MRSRLRGSGGELLRRRLPRAGKSVFGAPVQGRIHGIRRFGADKTGGISGNRDLQEERLITRVRWPRWKQLRERKWPPSPSDGRGSSRSSGGGARTPSWCSA